MRKDCIARRPDLTLKIQQRKRYYLLIWRAQINTIKIVKRGKMIGKYNRLWFELQERREGYEVNVIPAIIGCLGGGLKEQIETIRQIFEYDNNKELE